MNTSWKSASDKQKNLLLRKLHWADGGGIPREKLDAIRQYADKMTSIEANHLISLAIDLENIDLDRSAQYDPDQQRRRTQTVTLLMAEADRILATTKTTDLAKGES